MEQDAIAKATRVKNVNVENALGIGWYFAIFFLVVLLMYVASMLLGSLMPAMGAEAYVLIAVCILAGVIVCCAVYLGSVLLRTRGR